LGGFNFIGTWRFCKSVVLLSSLARSTKERIRQPPPKFGNDCFVRACPILQVQFHKSEFTRPILHVQFYKTNFTRPILQDQFYNSYFISPVLQALLAQSQRKCLLLFTYNIFLGLNSQKS
jgi:hypothetical protein